MPVQHIGVLFTSSGTSDATRFQNLKFLKPIENIGYRILGVDMWIRATDASGNEVNTNNVRRCQLVTGNAENFINPPSDRVVVECTDNNTQVTFAPVVLCKSGLFPQQIMRLEPFTGDEISLIARCGKGAANNVMEIWARITYDTVKVSSSEYIIYSV